MGVVSGRSLGVCMRCAEHYRSTSCVSGPPSFFLQSYVLLTGWDKAALLSNKNGEPMATIKLPCQPVEAPKIADFDNDGLNDVIFLCRQA